MKKHLILLFLVIFSVCNSFAQSKKDQIEQLNYRVDSLIRVLSSERINIKKEKASLEQYIVDLDKTITKLNAQAAKDISLIKSKELELSKVSSALSSLTSLLKVKSDSLNLVLADLEKLKPPVKVSPVIPVLDNKGPIKGVAIGTQVWTTKNLDVATFRNGDLIPEAKTDEEWKAAGENKQPAWCYYDNKAANGTKYGKLYNWYAVVDYRGLAPAGWHVPTDEEWTVLSTYLGGKEVAGEKMKSRSGWDSYIEDITCANCESWNAEYRRKKECNVCQDTRINGKKTFSANGTNSSGFSALPGGWRGYYKNGYNVGDSGFWWSASESSESEPLYRHMFSYKYSFLNEGKYLFKKSDGFSVRCVKD
jgi:hypothetical protein